MNIPELKKKHFVGGIIKCRCKTLVANNPNNISNKIIDCNQFQVSTKTTLLRHERELVHYM